MSKRCPIKYSLIGDLIVIRNWLYKLIWKFVRLTCFLEIKYLQNCWLNPQANKKIVRSFVYTAKIHLGVSITYFIDERKKCD